MQGPIEGRNFREGQELAKADLHLHSNYSYDVINVPALSPRALYDRAIERGMGFFTLTDHETMRGVLALRDELDAEFGSEHPIPVMNGIEIYVKDREVGHVIHVNVLGLDPKQANQLAKRRKNLGKFLDFCRAEGLYHVYNHPFWFENGESASLETISDLVAMFPVIELNAGRISQLNWRTVELAREHGRNLVAASDSHTGRIGRAYTMAPGRTPEQFLGNITDGNSVVVPRNTSLKEFISEVQDTIDLVFGLQHAFPIKRTFLRQHPKLRVLAKVALGSERVMQPGKLQAMVRRSLALIAYAPASHFILEQKRMNQRLEKALAEAGLADSPLTEEARLAH